MTLNKLASAIAKREGKKSQAHIGDIREILGIISDMFYADPMLLRTFYRAGFKRSKGKKK